jgi:hypothetical protein
MSMEPFMRDLALEAAKWFSGITMRSSWRELAIFTAPDAEHAEVLACKHALELARDQGSTKVHIDSDCLSAVAKLGSSDIDRSVHG